jgi:N-methylhydantoinase B
LNVAKSRNVDPITREVFLHRFSSLCEEMGAVLCRSAFSANIKERRDFSCALFDRHGELVAQAAHIPVHLGSIQLAVREAVSCVRLGPGDVVAINDPFAGGTHLPDLTLVAPVFLAGETRPVAFVAARAHHADIGGAVPGSMPLSEEIFQEGLRIPPLRCVRGGRWIPEFLRLFLANTRVPEERRGDLFAQFAAIRIGQKRLVELARRHGRSLLEAAMDALQDYSERLTRVMIARIPNGRYTASDFLDDDGLGTRLIQIRVALHVQSNRLHVDFAGSSDQVPGCVNANLAITWAAVLYVIQSLAGGRIPANGGLMRPVTVSAPEGSVVNARYPAAVAGGNVETSQRIVDVLFRALARALPGLMPAASGGSMNNVALGGFDPIRRRYFTYYETIAGGAGAGPAGAGESGVQTHMTNTWNTPIEALEAAYPLRVTEYRIRARSGGRGLHPGGAGLVREIQALCPLRYTLLTDRRSTAPWGLEGGKPGQRGANVKITTSGKVEPCRPKETGRLNRGERLRIETPGGGGWRRQKGRGARGR